MIIPGARPEDRRRLAAGAAALGLAAAVVATGASAAPPANRPASDGGPTGAGAPAANATVPLGEADVRIDGAGRDDMAGRSVAGVGDVNGDLVPDAIVGAANEFCGGSDSGCAYVLFGGRSTGYIDLGELNGEPEDPGFRIVGAADDMAGWSVAGAGDVNRDGLADVIVGAPGAAASQGTSYVVFGSPTTREVNLGSLGDRGFKIRGAAGGDQAGWSVAGAGDVNRDGIPDSVVGARGVNGSRGAAYVVFGPGADQLTDPVDLGRLGERGFRIEGVNAGDKTGHSVAGAGDVNRDGYPDVAVTAPYADNANQDAGFAYVIWGKRSTDTVELRKLGTGGFRIEGAGLDTRTGNAVAGAGYVDHDRYADVIVGAFRRTDSDVPGSRPGAAYVVWGKRSASTVYLGSLGADGFRIQGAADKDQAGWSVGEAGYVNGDRRSDLIVGAPMQGTGRPGAAYVVYGGDLTDTVDLGNLGGQGVKLDGVDPNDRAGSAVGGLGDFNGDRDGDVIVGALEADGPGEARPNAGAAYIVGSPWPFM